MVRLKAGLQLLALGGLWTTVVLLLWLAGVQLFLGLLVPLTYWQRPALQSGQVVRIEKDPEDVICDKVWVLKGAEERLQKMYKSEVAELSVGESFWSLRALYVTPIRPTHLRLTPLRLLLEYPHPFLVLAFAAAWSLHRRRERLTTAPPPVDPQKPRRVLTDDFHRRAERHGEPPPQGTAAESSRTSSGA